MQAALGWLTQLSATPHQAAWVRTPQLLPLPAPQAQASHPQLVASAPLALVWAPLAPVLALEVALVQALVPTFQAPVTTTTTLAPLAQA